MAGLDYLLQQMGERGMKAVLYLNNAWEWSGGYGFYLEHAGAGKARPVHEQWLVGDDYCGDPAQE